MTELIVSVLNKWNSPLASHQDFGKSFLSESSIRYVSESNKIQKRLFEGVSHEAPFEMGSFTCDSVLGA